MTTKDESNNKDVKEAIVIAAIPKHVTKEDYILWLEERVEGVEDAMKSINTTLNNHMNDYKRNFELLEANVGGNFDLMNERISTLTGTFWKIVGILSALLFLVIGALVAIGVEAAWR